MAEKIKSINWINIFLFFSLALNFFVAGYMVSDNQINKSAKVKQIIHKRPEFRIVDYFPNEERRKFRNLMKENRNILIESNRHILESQRAIFKIIAEPEMDENLLRKSFENYLQSNDQLQTQLNDIVVNMLLEMDYKTRLEIIERGRNAHERRKAIRQKWRRMQEGYEGPRSPD